MAGDSRDYHRLIDLDENGGYYVSLGATHTVTSISQSCFISMGRGDFRSSPVRSRSPSLPKKGIQYDELHWDVVIMRSNHFAWFERCESMHTHVSSFPVFQESRLTCGSFLTTVKQVRNAAAQSPSFYRGIHLRWQDYLLTR